VKILAIETSVACGSVALLDGEQTLLRTMDEPRTHAERLLPCIDELLREVGISAAALDAIAFGRGPGSFIGVRLASAVAQGLAAAADVGLAPVSSMAALAHRAMSEHAGTDDTRARTVICLDARMNEVYVGEFEPGDDRALAMGEERIEAADAVVLPGDGNWLASGNAFAAYAELAALATQRYARLYSDLEPQADDLLPFARASVMANELVAPEDWRSAYLRDESAWRRVK
jgi:tRNA threonylcarbamoyladenosine biosynthesis protein TsaB